jgi:ubiquinone/menaquinone biosynthesis C-methylase UbiE
VQLHHSDASLLGRRTLENDHPRLSEILQPGMRVLDVGCGSGSITSGIAEAVGTTGYVVGVDRDETLLRLATPGSAVYRCLDAAALDYERDFDVVTAARTLQWIADPLRVVQRMAAALKPGGRMVLLDYNHARNEWRPSPPPSFQIFFRRFVQWRGVHGWDNYMGDHLPELLEQVGLQSMVVTEEDECGAATDLWSRSVRNVQAAMLSDGLMTTEAMDAAFNDYEAWRQQSEAWQRLSLRAAVATRKE